MRAEIPAVVLQFISRRIDSVPELEALLIMSAEGERSWSATDIARLTYVPEKIAISMLRNLQRQGLVQEDKPRKTFRFNPSGDEERRVVEQTAAAYRDHLVSIATFIHQKAATPVHEFARAFSLKKDD